jgi:hypothetical protein
MKTIEDEFNEYERVLNECEKEYCHFDGECEDSSDCESCTYYYSDDDVIPDCIWEAMVECDPDLKE